MASQFYFKLIRALVFVADLCTIYFLYRKVQTKDLPNIVLPEGYEESIGSQEEILERARQEAIVQRRVVELRKQGLWSQRRMPKVSQAFRKF